MISYETGLRLLRPLTMALAFLLLSGCAGLMEKEEPPRVTLADVQLLDMQLLEQRYLVTLRIQNPNRTELAIEGLSFELDINDRTFAHGVSNEPATVAGFGEELLEVSVVSSLFSVIDQLRNLEKQRGKPLTYRLKGKVSLAGSLVSIPFDESGEFGGFSGAAEQAKP